MEETAYHSESEIDSDEELQEAFRTGKLKPGLNVVKEKAVRTYVNNEKALLSILERFGQKLPWLERLDLTNRPAPLAPELRQDAALQSQTDDSGLAEDDFRRETMFYRQAQAAVLEGIPRLQQLGVPTRRPDDFLAQMVKSDQQMDKVRKYLIDQKTRKEMSEKARKLRELKKLGKKTQVEVQQRKAREKRHLLERVKKYRKGQESSLDFLETDAASEQQAGKRKQQQQQRRTGSNEKRVSKKRQERDARFGFGGRKRGQKRNTAESAADTGWMAAGRSRKANKFITKRPGKNKRPGKAARQKNRARHK